MYQKETKEKEIKSKSRLESKKGTVASQQWGVSFSTARG
jgi:hypothetical protein